MGTVTDADDRISYKLFTNNILAMKQKSDELNDDWELLGTMENGDLYLKKKVIKIYNDVSNKKTNFEWDMLIYEYHITYNISYAVPMLCLNIWDTDGNCLTMEETWKLFDKKYSQEDMFSVLTQKEHPVLLKPFLVLHPCKTWDIIQNTLATSNNPVLSWLSSIAPAVNLELNNEYENLTRNSISSNATSEESHNG